MKKAIKAILLVAFAAIMCFGTFSLMACSSPNVSIDKDGNYKIKAIDGAVYYVVEIYDSEDVADGAIKTDAQAVFKQTVQETSGQFKNINLSFGSYTTTVYAVMSDKSKSEVFIGDEYKKGGTLTTPEFVVQRDYGEIKISITDKIFDEVYFTTETVYSFTAEIYDNAQCNGSAVASVNFGRDVEQIPPTQSDTPIWIRNRSVSVPVSNGTYYVRVKADGNAKDDVKESQWAATKSVVIDGSSTDVKYVTYRFDLTTGKAVAIGENRLEFGNGKRQKFETMIQLFPGGDGYTDERNSFTADEIIEKEDLYTLFTDDGTCLDLHLLGKSGDRSGEAYTTCARPMPVDKPDIRGTWKFVDDNTIDIVLMDDFQYFVDAADEKTT